jgi:hypothetical protein
MTALKKRKGALLRKIRDATIRQMKELTDHQ